MPLGHRRQHFDQTECGEAIAAAPRCGTIGRVIEQTIRALQALRIVDHQAGSGIQVRWSSGSHAFTRQDAASHEHVVGPALTVFGGSVVLARGGERHPAIRQCGRVGVSTPGQLGKHDRAGDRRQENPLPEKRLRAAQPGLKLAFHLVAQRGVAGAFGQA